MEVDPDRVRSFASAEDLWRWLSAHGGDEPELWVKVAKKNTGIASVDWTDCVIAAIAHGWIDGIRKPLDETWYLQRLTPRRKRSPWSKRNRAHAERLIGEGRMTDAGLFHVEAARADGRWEAAYEGQAEFEVPEDFLAALEERPSAKETFATLNRQNLFAIYYRLTSAASPETRERRLWKMIETLERGDRFY